MNSKSPFQYIGRTPQQPFPRAVAGAYVSLFDETFYKISNYDALPPFFMSLVSSSNHWMFVVSNGGISAGRQNSDHALFPYYTVDKLTDNHENTGARCILKVNKNSEIYYWEPLSDRYQGIYAVERNLYKNIPGNVLIFEEVNLDLGLTYRYSWRTGDTFGFVKTSWLVNHSADPCSVELLDGLHNLLPAFIAEFTQNIFSPLLDAYKKNELDPGIGLGIYTLNSTLTDLAEPSESLLSTVCWQCGLPAHAYYLSSQQLENFRAGLEMPSQSEIRGQRGAYFAHAFLELQADVSHSWYIVADVDQDAACVVNLSALLRDRSKDLKEMLENDLKSNTSHLEYIVASADGLQTTGHSLHSAHHFANVMFNEMRGGYFPGQYQISKSDLVDFLSRHNKTISIRQAAFITDLPSELSLSSLRERASTSDCTDLIRLANSYLPLSFSRRHGDPSRPWNRFSINIKKRDGSQQLDYEGNWRDIFQNWEALAYSYPEYVENMISVFLNATTADGYNPYRIARNGIDWEIPEPNNPWANIGYWSDHQIIYLQKLLEISQSFHPGWLDASLAKPIFSYADVPFLIKPYSEILQDPFNTIVFDWNLQKRAIKRVGRVGSDGKLVHAADGQVLHATLMEKLLTLLLAKLVNFVPEGGIWMNTQRPEWNDANNALVGKGLSVVTLAYLRRTIVFLREMLRNANLQSFPVHAEVADFHEKITQILSDTLSTLQDGFTDSNRRLLMDALGQAGSDYRMHYYQSGFSGTITAIKKSAILTFLEVALLYVDQSLRANCRSDGLYHSYNILHIEPGGAAISRLYEMLEGQVAILSSGLLSGEESLELLNNLRSGPLYRRDQHSYILYPDRQLKGFVEKNLFSPQLVEGLALVQELHKAGDETLLVCDQKGNFHFAGHIHNKKNVRNALIALGSQPRFNELVSRDSQAIESIFEKTFQHDHFTGRSGTFFAYEGLGSVYWHMVSKLLLAVQETIQRTKDELSTSKLLKHYQEIRSGQCFNKTPAEYGAFPTDPYSHTPAGLGAKQPGMSGMVKEEILARQAELGFTVVKGCINFDFLLLTKDEWLKAPARFKYLNTLGQWEEIELPAGTLAYTICQVPVILRRSPAAAIQVHFRDGSVVNVNGRALDDANSRHIFGRDGMVHHVDVAVH